MGLTMTTSPHRAQTGMGRNRESSPPMTIGTATASCSIRRSDSTRRIFGNGDRQRAAVGRGASRAWSMFCITYPSCWRPNPARRFSSWKVKKTSRHRGRGPGGRHQRGRGQKWRAEYNQHLAGRHVVITPDNDDTGREHAAQVAESLDGTAASIRVLQLPGLPVKGDVSDWLQAGGNREALEAMAEATERWSPADSVPDCSPNGTSASLGQVGLSSGVVCRSGRRPRDSECRCTAYLVPATPRPVDPWHRPPRRDGQLHREVPRSARVG